MIIVYYMKRLLRFLKFQREANQNRFSYEVVQRLRLEDYQQRHYWEL